MNYIPAYTVNYMLYRKIENHGWYVVGYSAAKKLGVSHYATPSATCSKGHVAPMSVVKTKCIKCLAVESRKKGTDLTNEQSYEYWRRKLKLPRVVTVRFPRYCYVVDNMPYTRLSEAAAMTGVEESTIYYRCTSDKYPDYHRIPTRFVRNQSHLLICGKNTYNTMVDAVEGEQLNSQVILIRINSVNWPDWKKEKVL